MGGKCLQYLGFIRQSGPGATVLVSIWFCPTKKIVIVNFLSWQCVGISLRNIWEGESEGRRCCLLITKRDRPNGEKQHGHRVGKSIFLSFSKVSQCKFIWIGLFSSCFWVSKIQKLQILWGRKLYWTKKCRTKPILKFQSNGIQKGLCPLSHRSSYELLKMIWGVVKKYADATFWVIAAKNYSNNSTPWWSRRL